MKKHLLFIAFVIFGMSLMVSCQSEPEIFNNEQGETNNDGMLETRAFSIDVTPDGLNHNLHTDWESMTIVKLNKGNITPFVPWYPGSTSASDIPWNYASDIKAVDGWKMLSHTMIYENSGDPDYMLFYNEKTGVLKGFYYNHTPHPNQCLVWILRLPNGATSILPNNQVMQGPMTTTNTHISTSNIVKDNLHNFNSLEEGWNAFSFELPYGTLNNSPLLAIEAYHSTISNLTLNGNYSGEVVIPIATSSQSLFGKILSSLPVISGAIGKFIEIPEEVDKVISAMGMAFGATSWTKKNGAVSTIRATSSGKIALTGTESLTQVGTVRRLWDIDIKRFNDNKAVGVWNLSQLPSFNFHKYSYAEDGPYDEVHGNVRYQGYVPVSLPTGRSMESYIVINPYLSNQIRSYRVIDTQFYMSRPRTPWVTSYEASSVYTTNFDFDVVGGSFPAQRPGEREYGQNYAIFKETSPSDFTGVCLNLTIEIEYMDGTILQSSRSYDNLTFNQVDNISLVNDASRYSITYIFHNF